MTEARPAEGRALLIDLDGTLVHSAPDLAAALNRLRAELELAPLALDRVTAMVGDGIAKLVERGLDWDAERGPKAEERAALVARFQTHYESRLCVETRPYPGVAGTLESLVAEGWRLAVCTNKLESASRAILDELGLGGFFAAVGGGDSFAERKPAAGHPLGTLARLGARPEAAVMVGDSHNDVAAARNAGLPVVLVSYGYTRDPARALGADAVIDRFDELPAALARLGV